jgi:hypothetical protein
MPHEVIIVRLRHMSDETLPPGPRGTAKDGVDRGAGWHNAAYIMEGEDGKLYYHSMYDHHHKLIATIKEKGIPCLLYSDHALGTAAADLHHSRYEYRGPVAFEGPQPD